jgi:hypothetical protein
LLHRDWSLYDTYHAVFRPRRMAPDQLEAGYHRARRAFAAWNSILHRSLGLPGALKRIAYNAAWMKMDPLWVAIIRAGLMPFATRIFERVLRLSTRYPIRESAAAPWHVHALPRRQSPQWIVLNDHAVNRPRGEGGVSCDQPELLSERKCGT